MVFCICATKPVLINGVCHVCQREPAPHDTRSTLNEITRPGLDFEVLDLRDAEVQNKFVKYLQPA